MNEYEKPDLIIIDGGKGQLSISFSVLQESKLEGIEMISLAKQMEEVLRIDSQVGVRVSLDGLAEVHNKIRGIANIFSQAIDTIKEENLLENAARQGNYILKRLNELKERSKIVGDVRGKGLMIGVEIVEDKDSKKAAPDLAKEIMMRSWKRGVAIITCGVSTLRIAPPLIITRELVDAAMEIIEDVISEVEREKTTI